MTAHNNMAVVLGLTLVVLGADSGAFYLQAQADGNGAGSPAPTDKLAATARPKPVQFQHGRKPISALVFSPDGKALAVGNHDRMACIYDAATGKKLHEFPGNGRMVTSVAFSPDGKTLAVAGSTIRLWDVPSGRELEEVKGDQEPVNALIFGSSD